MRAARWLSRRKVALEQIPDPIPRDDQAVIAVEWVGLCGSDVEEYLYGPIVIRPPVTLGHEIVGRVLTAARDGTGPSTGTRVVVDVVNGCGHCYWCARHDEGLCKNLVVTGQHLDGGLAEYVLARAERLVTVPEGVDPRHAALAEPLSVAVRAVRKAGPLLGKSLLVIGGGTIGILSAQVAVAAGANPVVVVEPKRTRRELIASWGITAVWQGEELALRHAVEPELPERGIDVVLECSGQSGMTAEAIRLCRRGGKTILLSVLPKDEPIDALDLVLGEKTLQGSSAHMWDDDLAVAVALLAAGRVDVAPLITHTLLLDAVSDAFEALIDPAGDVIKLLVEVDGSRPHDPATGRN